MATYRIELSGEEARRIEELARESGLAPEELIQRSVERWLNTQEKEFADAATYVLKKNAVLYKRLS